MKNNKPYIGVDEAGNTPRKDKLHVKITNSPDVETIPVKIKRKKKKISLRKKNKFLNKGGNAVEKALFLDSISKKNLKVQKDFEIIKPLKPVFIAGLKAKGLTPPKDLPVLSEKFYNEVVLKSNKTPMSKYSDIMKPQDICNCPPSHLEPAKEAILSGIVDFIKNVKSKKEAGGSLSRVEEVVYNSTKTVEGNVNKKAKDEASKKVGEQILFNKNVQIGIVVVIVSIILLFVFKK